MITTTQKLITSDDPKGRQATDLFRGAYNKAQLTEGQAQRLNENKGGNFTTELLWLIQQHSSTDQYEKEMVSSNYTYPKEYNGPKPIIEQIKTIATIFGLDPTQALEFAKKLPTLPEGAEGWFAIPKVSVIAKKYFPAITDERERYCAVLMLVLEKTRNTRVLRCHYENQIVSSQLRQSSNTMRFMQELDATQEGDIIIIAAQYGMRHRGKSVRRVRELLVDKNEFGLCPLTVSFMNLIHPERFVQENQLNVYCAGADFTLRVGGPFSQILFFELNDGVLEISEEETCCPSRSFGSPSAFIPQD